MRGRRGREEGRRREGKKWSKGGDEKGKKGGYVWEKGRREEK